MATTSTEALTHAWYCDILISTDRDLLISTDILQMRKVINKFNLNLFSLKNLKIFKKYYKI